jgi:methionine-rich copper-binding protein CopC
MKNLVLIISAFCFSVSAAYSFNTIKDSGTENASRSETGIANFSLNSSGDQIMISWLSIEQSDVETIELEKAENIEEFKSISTLKGFYSTAALRYNSVDMHPVMGQNNYRLRLVNKDGSVVYSEVISIGYRPQVKIKHLPRKNVKSQDKYGLSTSYFLNQTLNPNAA